VRLWRWPRLRVAVVAIVALLVPGGRAGLATDVPAGWSELGPSGALRISEVAAAPNWRDGGSLIGLRNSGLFNSDLVRTSDAGKSWTWLPSPVPFAGGLTMLAASDDTTVTFLSSQQMLYRSDDSGTAWQSVLQAGPSADFIQSERGREDVMPPVSVVASPDWEHDGLMFARADSRLFRSSDKGVSWAEIPQPAGQQAQQVVVSPDFVRDRTVFAVLVSDDFPEPQYDRYAYRGQAPDNEQSVGILVSHDGGESWASMSESLISDGVTYRHVQQIVISPTYETDGTIFAVAWGPRGATAGPDTILFRSRDRGQTWDIARESSGRAGSYAWPYVALSPTFSSDGAILVASESESGAAHSGQCLVSLSVDGGDHWRSFPEADDQSICAQERNEQPAARHPQVVFSREPDGLHAYAHRRWTWRRSDDLGLTATELPQSVTRINVLSTPHAETAEDTTFALVGTSIWTTSASSASTDGTYPCPYAPGFTLTPEAASNLRSRGGCAIGAETDVTMRLSRATPLGVSEGACAVTYWLDIDLPRWIALEPCRLDLPGEHRIGSQPRPNGEPLSSTGRTEVGTKPARFQRFEVGGVLTFQNDDGDTLHILISARGSSWFWEIIPTS
jgi:photosystem II stability/assembly factor-like uncharacterized protein